MICKMNGVGFIEVNGYTIRKWLHLLDLVAIIVEGGCCDLNESGVNQESRDYHYRLIKIS